MFFFIPSNPFRASHPDDLATLPFLPFHFLEKLLSAFWLFANFLLNIGCFVFAKPSWGQFRL